MAMFGDCSGQQTTDYRFVRPEFNAALLVVFLGVLRLVNRRKSLAYTLDVVSSAYLLWATHTRQYYLHSTSVGQWASDLCAAIVSDKNLIYNYLAVSVVSWVASSFLECNSVIHFKKLYSTRLWRWLKGDAWLVLSRSRWLVLTLALICTVNSLALTLVLWGTVHHSFENVSKDRSILTFNTIAALMRLLRQFMEGLIFIAGIVTRDFRWRSVRERKLMGRIAFSSFMLLIHSSVLTYTFCATRVWSVDQLTLFFALLVDVIFQLVVCVWAALNSCCYARAQECIETLTFHPAVRSFRHFSSIAANALCTCARAAHLVCSCTLPLRGFLYLYNTVAVQTILMFAVGAIHLVCFCVSLVLTEFVEAWRNYVLHWHIDVDFDDPDLELVEAVQIQLVYQETQRHMDVTRSEVVFPPYSAYHQCHRIPHHMQWNVLYEAIWEPQYCTTQNEHAEHNLLSQPDERESMPQMGLSTFEIFPQPVSMPPHMSSQPFYDSPPQSLPLQQKDAIIAPSLPSTKHFGQHSKLVAR